MSLRSGLSEIRALATTRRAPYLLWSRADLIMERYGLLAAAVDRSTASLIGTILNALH
jgi:hypothetical protein